MTPEEARKLANEAREMTEEMAAHFGASVTTSSGPALLLRLASALNDLAGRSEADDAVRWKWCSCSMEASPGPGLGKPPCLHFRRFEAIGNEAEERQCQRCQHDRRCHPVPAGHVERAREWKALVAIRDRDEHYRTAAPALARELLSRVTLEEVEAAMTDTGWGLQDGAKKQIMRKLRAIVERRKHGHE